MFLAALAEMLLDHLPCMSCYPTQNVYAGILCCQIMQRVSSDQGLLPSASVCCRSVGGLHSAAGLQAPALWTVL